MAALQPKYKLYKTPTQIVVARAEGSGPALVIDRVVNVLSQHPGTREERECGPRGCVRVCV